MTLRIYPARLRRPVFFLFLPLILFSLMGSRCHAAASAYVRVNLVGYQPTETKQAVVLASTALTGTFSVVSNGVTIFSALIPSTNAGSWSATFGHTYLLDFSSVTNPGVYVIQIASSINATSPPVTIGTAPALY